MLGGRSGLLLWTGLYFDRVLVRFHDITTNDSRIIQDVITYESC